MPIWLLPQLLFIQQARDDMPTVTSGDDVPVTRVQTALVALSQGLRQSPYRSTARTVGRALGWEGASPARLSWTTFSSIKWNALGTWEKHLRASFSSDFIFWPAACPWRTPVVDMLNIQSASVVVGSFTTLGSVAFWGPLFAVDSIVIWKGMLVKSLVIFNITRTWKKWGESLAPLYSIR